MDDRKYRYVISGQFYNGQRNVNIFADCPNLEQARGFALEQSLRYVGTTIILTTIVNGLVKNESIYLNGNVYLKKKEPVPHAQKRESIL